MDKIREGILEALLDTYKPLWSVLSAVASPGTGRVYSTADGINLVRQCYAFPKLRNIHACKVFSDARNSLLTRQRAHHGHSQVWQACLFP